MKTILIIFFISFLLNAQTDSTRLKYIQRQFIAIQKAYSSTDSLQLKRKGILEFLQSEYIKERNKISTNKKRKKK